MPVFLQQFPVPSLVYTGQFTFLSKPHCFSWMSNSCTLYWLLRVLWLVLCASQNELMLAWNSFVRLCGLSFFYVVVLGPTIFRGNCWITVAHQQFPCQIPGCLDSGGTCWSSYNIIYNGCYIMIIANGESMMVVIIMVSHFIPAIYGKSLYNRGTMASSWVTKCPCSSCVNRET